MANQNKQKRFLLKHIDELKEAIKNDFCPKVLEDSLYILKKGWATEISYKDLSHVHIALPNISNTVIMEKILSEVFFLYHSFEFLETTEEQKEKRNIYSTLYKKPFPLNAEKLNIKTNSANTIFLPDLDAWEIASGRFFINKKPEILNKKYDISITLNRNGKNFNFVFYPLESVIKDYI